MKTLFKTIALAAIASLAITGCIKHDPFGHRVDPDHGGNGGGKEEEKLVMTERTDWTIRYMGREKNNGQAFEKFRISYNGTAYIFPLIISPDDLKNVYDNDILSFFNYEVGLLQKDYKANTSVKLDDLGVYTSSVQEVFFNRHGHGTWIAYLVELDTSLKLTGKFAENAFTIQEEVASDAFRRWIGKYHVFDGYSGFDIEVSSADANYLYYVDGWETGDAVSEKMNQERDWIYARFDDGDLVFYAQFLTTEQYDGKDVDQVFAGTYLTSTSDSNGDLDWEGVDYEDPIASVVQDGSRLILQPKTVHFDNGYSFTYHSMRYSRLWFTDNGSTVNWAYYNVAGVPSLPAEMTVITDSAGTRSSASGPAVRMRSKGSVHRDQLKPVRSARTAKK